MREGGRWVSREDGRRFIRQDEEARLIRGPWSQLAPVGRVPVRRMFGKTGVFYDGLMLGMLTENTLDFPVDDLKKPSPIRPQLQQQAALTAARRVAPKREKTVPRAETEAATSE